MSQHRSDRPNVPRRSPDPPRQTPQPYRVVLLQDTRNDLMFIIRTVMELTRFCRDEATHKMWQAHHTGRSVILVTYRERAELFAELFVSKGLDVIVEPA
jgi:ATP-dependent Clp protease adapter protein ClpS